MPKISQILLLFVASIPALSWGAGAEFSQYDAVVTPLLAKMTLAEKVGQMTQADLSGLKSLDEVHELALGSVLSGGNADPADGNTREAWVATVAQCQAQVAKTRLALPLLYGIDAVHGNNNVLGAVIFPHNIGLGCANDPDLVERIGRVTAKEVRATGIQWTFAPCVTVPRDDRWGRTYEGFSEDPARVGPLGAALVRGLQGKSLGYPGAVLACAKHWVGDGGTAAEMRESNFQPGIGLRLDQGDTRCDEATLRSLHVAPYHESLAEGVGTVMVTYSSWNGVKCTARKDLITDLLKTELGFEGLVVSDYNAIDQCHPDYKTAIGKAINAGIDMAMVYKSQKKFVRLLTELVNEGVVPTARIDDAVRRILRVKAAMGLLEKGALDRQLDATGFGSAEHRAVAREAVQKSLVVLKNDGVLPLRRMGRVHVAGAAADDLGVQCGGWTIDWQGKKGEVTSGGTTLLAGLREVLGQGVEVTHDANGSSAKGADAVVVVVGERPYAEGVGDDEHLTLDADQLQTINRAKVSGAKVCLVLLSGRPLELDATALGCNAVVAAWLPGTEGAGVADVLVGDAPATGRLSYSWPRKSSDHPLNVGDTDYAPLYPLGHGLDLKR